jgi:hypothetical protein
MVGGCQCGHDAATLFAWGSRQFRNLQLTLGAHEERNASALIRPAGRAKTVTGGLTTSTSNRARPDPAGSR